MRKKILCCVIAAVLVLAALGSRELTKADDPGMDLDFTYTPELDGAYRVLWVADGDTFVVDMDGSNVYVRMIGVDAPESVHTDELRNTPEGETASVWLKELLKSEWVYLEYDAERTDKYDRLLAYVYLESGEMVNRLLLENGMAEVMVIPPNDRYAEEFYQVQAAAMSDGVGLWEANQRR